MLKGALRFLPARKTLCWLMTRHALMALVERHCAVRFMTYSPPLLASAVKVFASLLQTEPPKQQRPFLRCHTLFPLLFSFFRDGWNFKKIISWRDFLDSIWSRHRSVPATALRCLSCKSFQKAVWQDSVFPLCHWVQDQATQRSTHVQAKTWDTYKCTHVGAAQAVPQHG